MSAVDKKDGQDQSQLDECRAVERSISEHIASTSHEQVTCLQGSSRWIITGSSRGALFLFNRKLGRSARPLRTRDNEHVTCVRIWAGTTDAEHDRVAVGHRSGRLVLLQLDAKIRQHVDVEQHRGAAIVSLAWTRDGRCALSANGDGQLLASRVHFDEPSTCVHTLLVSVPSSIRQFVYDAETGLICLLSTPVQIFKFDPITCRCDEVRSIAVQSDFIPCLVGCTSSAASFFLLSTDGRGFSTGIHQSLPADDKNSVKLTNAVKNAWTIDEHSIALLDDQGHLTVFDVKDADFNLTARLHITRQLAASSTIIDVSHDSRSSVWILVRDSPTFAAKVWRWRYRETAESTPFELMSAATENVSASSFFSSASSSPAAHFLDRLRSAAPQTAAVRTAYTGIAMMRDSLGKHLASAIPTFPMGSPSSSASSSSNTCAVDCRREIPVMDPILSSSSSSSSLSGSDTAQVTEIRMRDDADEDLDIVLSPPIILPAETPIVVRREGRRGRRVDDDLLATTSPSLAPSDDLASLCPSEGTTIVEGSEPGTIYELRREFLCQQDHLTAAAPPPLEPDLPSADDTKLVHEAVEEGPRDETAVEEIVEIAADPVSGPLDRVLSKLHQEEDERLDESADTKSPASQERPTVLAAPLLDELRRLAVATSANDRLDIWTEWKVPFTLHSFAVTRTHVVVCGKRHTHVRTRPISDVNATWTKTSLTAERILVDGNAHHIWRITPNGVVMAGLLADEELGPDGLPKVWHEISTSGSVIPSTVVLTDRSAWYGTVMKEICTIRLDSKGRQVPKHVDSIPAKITALAAQHDAVWALQESGSLSVRVGMQHDPVGQDWVDIEPDGPNLPLRSVSLCEGTGWAIDQQCRLWFVGGVNANYPYGKKWYETWWPMLESSSPSPLVFVQSTPNGVWIHANGRLFHSRGPLSGYRRSSVVRPLPTDPVERARFGGFTHLAIGSFASGKRTLRQDDASIAYLLRTTDSELFRWRASAPTKLDSFPPIASSSSIVSVASNLRGHLFVVDEDGVLWQRSNMDAELCPLGSQWTRCPAPPHSEIRFLCVAASVSSLWAICASSETAERSPSTRFVMVCELDDSPRNWTGLEATPAEDVHQIRVSPLGGRVYCYSPTSIWARCNVGASHSLWGTKWTQAPSDRGVLCLAVADAAAWLLDGQQRVHRLRGLSADNPAGNYWRLMPGNFTAIAVDPRNALWALDVDGQLVRQSCDVYECGREPNTTTPPREADFEFV